MAQHKIVGDDIRRYFYNLGIGKTSSELKKKYEIDLHVERCPAILPSKKKRC